MANARQRTARIALGLLVAAAGISLWRMRRAGEDEALQPAAIQVASTLGAAPSGSGAPTGELPETSGEEHARFERWRRDPAAQARARQAADAARERIRTSRQSGAAARARSAAAPGRSQESGLPAIPPPEGSGNQRDKPLGHYVRDIVQDQFMPMGKACYEELLERSPRAAGKLVLNVVVAGESGLGAVVDSVAVEPGSTLEDEALATCMRESMYAVEFGDPPPGHEQFDFTYPLVLSPGPNPDSGLP